MREKTVRHGENRMGCCAGKNALVTGASRRIGHAIAKRLASEGASVVVAASRMGSHGDLEGTLDGIVAEIEQAGGRVAAEVANLVEDAARSDLVSRAEAAM